MPTEANSPSGIISPEAFLRRKFFRKEHSLKFMSQLPEQLRSMGRCSVPVPVCIALALLFNLEIACVVTIDNRLQARSYLRLRARFSR
jgi:hypothetical protein